MGNSTSAIDTISRYAPSEWNTVLSASLDAETDVFFNGEHHATLVKLSDCIGRIYQSVRQDFALDESIATSVLNHLEPLAQSAVRNLALHDSINVRGLPVSKAARSLSAINIDISDSVKLAINQSSETDCSIIHEIGLTSLKKGDTSVARTAFERLAHFNFTAENGPGEKLNAAYLNAAISAQGAATQTESLAMQADLVEILSIAPVDVSTPIKGSSIQDYCADNPELSYINNYISNAVLHRQLENSLEQSSSQEEEYSMVRKDRSF